MKIKHCLFLLLTTLFFQFSSFGSSKTTITLGITSPGGTTLGVMGHAFVVISKAGGDFFSSKTYSYAADSQNNESTYWKVQQALLGIPKLKMSESEFAQYLGSTVIGEGRTSYLFRLKIKPDKANLIAKSFERDYELLSQDSDVNYSIDNSCWTRVIKIINSHLELPNKIVLSENSFWESILFDFQNPVTRAKDLISFSPYYYLSELRKRTDLLREMSPFIGGTTRLVSVFYHLNSYISQLDDCIVNTETRNILTDYLHHKIIKKDYLSSLKALKKTSKLCQQNGSHELSITYNQILKLIKVSNPEIYNEASNLLTNNESVL